MLATMSSGIGWLAFSALAHAKSGLAAKTPHFHARAKRVIFLTMRGGPSHVDLFDYKPELTKRDGKTANLGRDSAGAKLSAPCILSVGTVSQVNGSPAFIQNSRNTPTTSASSTR